MRDFTHTSVSVTEGHPDKLCDQISDAVVDATLRLDPGARVEVECALATGVAFVACRASTELRVDLADVARGVIDAAGYSPRDFGPGAVPVMTSFGRMGGSARRSGSSPRRSRGASDHNVTTFGYATAATATRLPLPIELAHRLARQLSAWRCADRSLRISPDAQVQVTVQFEARRAVRVVAVTFLLGMKSAAPALLRELEVRLAGQVVQPALEELGMADEAAPDLVLVPEEQSSAWGPARHSGVTGRKLGIDTYGDFCRQPSSALSGKSPDRIDRMATYAARYAALNLVESGLADECEVQLSYTIGRSDPASFEVDTLGTGRRPDGELRSRLRDWLDLRAAAVVDRFRTDGSSAGVNATGLAALAVFGQVGRVDLVLPWERTETAAELLA
jgi:S-adenosylmethionine synthetase